ncbi:MAG: recombinase family protein [Lachnospiraceae bacterium]|nr:recombinase family protein [Lachnospiraceae bacterium]
MARTKDRARQEPRQEIKAGKTPAGTLLFRTATYARLSVDSAVTESDSITSQQMLMRDYIKGRDEFFLVREYKDDGISGTRFDRQAFDSLLGEVRKGNINCIIVKDFSRFGRDHIEVGNYLEKIFPFLGVRFISVNDGYDSFDKECADKKLAVILKNLVNEYIAKDTSVKVASSYVAKQESGEYDGGRAPYGYAFADKRKTRFLVDERPAGIVKDIFAWTMQGDSALAIVKRLTERSINPPKAYQDTGKFIRQEKGRCYWNEFTVNAILQNMAYVGHMALHKWKESKADGISPYMLDESEWKVTKNTHEAIITEQDFNLVQEILRARKERYKSRNAMDEAIIRPENLLKGKIFCGDCLVPASRMGTNYQRKAGKVHERVRIYRYRCRTYREKGARECTSKSISEKDLEGIVYQAVMTFVRQVECLDGMVSRFHNEFFQKMRRSMEKEKGMVERAVRQGKNEKILLYKEYTGRERGMKHNSIGQSGKEKNPDSNREWYLKEKQKKEDEIRHYEERKAQLEEKTDFINRLQKEQAGWIKEILSYKETVLGEEGLTAQMAALFVDKIFLYDGKRVEVVLNFRDEYQTLCQLIPASNEENSHACMDI